METKTYFADSVAAALEVARHELGEDALLVGSQAATDPYRKFGRLEVTFAFDPAAESGGSATPRHSVSEFEKIRREISALRETVVATSNSPGEDNFISTRLAAAGLDAAVAREISMTTQEKPGDPHELAVEELTRRISTVPFAMSASESRTLAFVGPPGRGKTTSLIKIATAHGLAKRIPVRIYSAGAQGVGQQEQMARYAAILGVPWHAYESTGALNLALNGDAWRGLALIDTPGLAPADRREMQEFEEFFSGRPEIETHLVLRADARSADNLQVLKRFMAFRPSRLLFAGVDEAVDEVSIVDVMARGRIPATFAGTGQRIPEDLEEMNASKLARALWQAAMNADGDNPARRAAAA
jgi:flagellar biosynthesis protein FlhF